VFNGQEEQTDAGVSREAVQLALTRGRTRREIAEDLGIGLSTVTRWLGQERDIRKPSEAPVDLHAELKRLRRENAVLKQERDILEIGEPCCAIGWSGMANAFFAAEGCGGWTPLVRVNPPRMTFGSIEAEEADPSPAWTRGAGLHTPISRMCHVLDVSQSGVFAWQEWPACRRRQQDMVFLARAIILGTMAGNGAFRTAFALSNGTYGSPRMHLDLVDADHEIGRHPHSAANATW
jgi:transposase